MNAPKHPTDLAPSTFARKRASDMLPWSKLYAETVLLMCGAAISDKAKLTFIRLQPMLKRSEDEGYLVEDGKPIALRTLARQIGKTEKALTNEIEELIEVRLLKKDGKKICDPWIVADKKATDFLNSRGQLSYNDDGSNLREDAEDSENEGVASQYSQSNNGFKHHTVEESRTENTRFSASTEAKASAFAGETACAPGGAAVPLTASACGITDAEIFKLKRDPKYAGKDVDDVIRKCRAKYPDRPITLKMVRGWLKRERPTATGAEAEHNGDEDSETVLDSSPAEVELTDDQRAIIAAIQGKTSEQSFLETIHMTLKVKPNQVWPIVDAAKEEGLWRTGVIKSPFPPFNELTIWAGKNQWDRGNLPSEEERAVA